MQKHILPAHKKNHTYSSSQYSIMLFLDNWDETPIELRFVPLKSKIILVFFELFVNHFLQIQKGGGVNSICNTAKVKLGRSEI